MAKLYFKSEKIFRKNAILCLQQTDIKHEDLDVDQRYILLWCLAITITLIGVIYWLYDASLVKALVKPGFAVVGKELNRVNDVIHLEYEAFESYKNELENLYAIKQRLYHKGLINLDELLRAKEMSQQFVKNDHDLIESPWLFDEFVADENKIYIIVQLSENDVQGLLELDPEIWIESSQINGAKVKRRATALVAVSRVQLESHFLARYFHQYNDFQPHHHCYLGLIKIDGADIQDHDHIQAHLLIPQIISIRTLLNI